MFLLLTALAGPTSDRHYSFWGTSNSHQSRGGGRAPGPWWTGYPAKSHTPTKQRGWLW